MADDYFYLLDYNSPSTSDLTSYHPLGPYCLIVCARERERKTEHDDPTSPCHPRSLEPGLRFRDANSKYDTKLPSLTLD